MPKIQFQIDGPPTLHPLALSSCFNIYAVLLCNGNLHILCFHNVLSSILKTVSVFVTVLFLLYFISECTVGCPLDLGIEVLESCQDGARDYGI